MSIEMMDVKRYQGGSVATVLGRMILAASLGLRHANVEMDRAETVEACHACPASCLSSTGIDSSPPMSGRRTMFEIRSFSDRDINRFVVVKVDGWGACRVSGFLDTFEAAKRSLARWKALEDCGNSLDQICEAVDRRSNPWRRLLEAVIAEDDEDSPWEVG